jgi:hypothetical protein
MATMMRAVAGPRSARRGYWRAQIEAQRGSGLSQAAFCARHGLRKGTFSFWKWKLTRDVGARPGRRGALATRSVAPLAFVPIQITAAELPGDAAARAPDGEVEITLGRDRRVRVRGRVDPAWLVQVLHGLEAPGC